MNKNFLTGVVAGLAGIFLLSGCESARYRPSDVFPRSEPMTLTKNPTVGESELLAHAAAQPSAPAEGEGWRPMFDGNSLTGWKVTNFDEGGRVEVKHGLLVFQMGQPFVGVNYTNEIPKVNYEVAFDAMRVSGSDFFCGLTFPVGDSYCSLIVGGWGGSLVGLSNLDSMDASENDTTQFIDFETGRWYRIRLRVTEKKIEAWIEQKKVVDVVTIGRKISLRFGEIEMSKPFGFASWTTSSAFRGIRLRHVEPGNAEK